MMACHTSSHCQASRTSTSIQVRCMGEEGFGSSTIMLVRGGECFNTSTSIQVRCMGLEGVGSEHLHVSEGWHYHVIEGRRVLQHRNIDAGEMLGGGKASR